MVDNSTNINKPKESLHSDGQQFLQYQQTKKKVLTVMVNNSSNINKTKKVLTVMIYNSSNINKPKESCNSDGQQFHQYQQNKRKF
jgi:hypothetical protein